MEFEWDDAKRHQNLVKHGIDFRDVRRLFDGRPVRTSRSAHAEEERFVTTGIIEERLVTAIWTPRGNAIRIISARRARDGEERAYRAVYSRPA